MKGDKNIMKECPNCKELLGDNVERCFSCKYDFKLQRTISRDEERQIENAIEEKRKQEEEKIRAEKEKVWQEEVAHRKELERIRTEYQECREKNALYEYEVVVLYDKPTGEFDVDNYRRILNKYSVNGWQLKSVFSNEIGKDSSGVGIGGFSTQVNATIDQTIITFERCIRPSRL